MDVKYCVAPAGAEKLWRGISCPRAYAAGLQFCRPCEPDGCNGLLMNPQMGAVGWGKDRRRRAAPHLTILARTTGQCWEMLLLALTFC